MSLLLSSANKIYSEDSKLDYIHIDFEVCSAFQPFEYFFSKQFLILSTLDQPF